MAGSWWCVVPVKPLTAAKSRLALPPADRMAIVVAMAGDTVATAMATPGVDGVVVVTDDPVAAAALTPLGAQVVPEPPTGGLNAALTAGAAAIVAAVGSAAVAALLPDLPSLTSAVLGGALARAGAHPRAYVSDAASSGTTLLTAGPAVALGPSFGPGSSGRHACSGAVRLTGVDPRLRTDVDTVDDLAAAVRLGLGPRTAAALQQVRTTSPPWASTRRSDSASTSSQPGGPARASARPSDPACASSHSHDPCGRR